MKENVKEFLVGKTKELKDAGTCCAELKEVCGEFLAAVGTDNEDEAARKLMAEIEEDIITVDGLIAFANSERGVQVFGGAEKAKEVAAHGEAIKAAGAKYCDCAACAICEEILAKKDEIL